LVSWSLTLNENAPHTFQFKLQNSQRKYDGTFLPMDRIRVGLKRINWLQCFTGYVNTSPVFQAWPGTLDLSATCTLKVPMYRYWDVNTTQALTMISQALMHSPTGQTIATTSNGIDGLTNLIIESMSQVLSWDKSKIHIGKIPDGWAEWANKIGDQIDRDLEVYRRLGRSAVINGETGSGVGGNLRVNLPAGKYGNETYNDHQVHFASILYNYINYDRQLQDRFDLKCMVMMCVNAESHFRNYWSAGAPGSENYPDNDGSQSPDHHSCGLFQQQYTTGWGSGQPLLCMNPTHACGEFLDRLLTVAPTLVDQSQWAQSVQKVQKSGFSDGSNYAKFVGNARAMVTAMDKISISGNTLGVNPSDPKAPLLPTESTGNLIAKVGWDLIKTHEASKTWIRYHLGGDDPDTTPMESVKTLDCSSLVDWVYNHATGGKRLWTGGRSTVATIHSTLKAQNRVIDLDLARWVRGAVLIAPDHHIGISLGDNTHVAAHTDGIPIEKQCTAGAPIDGNQFTRGGLLPGVDYSNSGTTQDAADDLKVVMNYPSTRVAPPLPSIPSPNGDVAIGPGGSGAVTAKEIYEGLINGIYFSAGNDPTLGDTLGGATMMENDEPFLPWLQTTVASSLRSFCSAPNGDFIAWYPDYFGLWGSAAVMNIEPIELQNFAVYWSDEKIVTHQFVLGNAGPTAFDQSSGTVGYGADTQETLGYLANNTAGIATMDYPEIFAALYHDQSVGADSGFIDAFLARFGARPDTVHIPQIVKGPDSNGGGSRQEFFYALYRFMQLWAGQFTAVVPITFMPELFPGMLLRIQEYGFQAYVQTVVHQGSYGDGGAFTTSVNICAPSTYGNKNTTTTLAWLPQGGQSL
jgi:hypothetical protein